MQADKDCSGCLLLHIHLLCLSVDPRTDIISGGNIKPIQVLVTMQISITKDKQTKKKKLLQPTMCVAITRRRCDFVFFLFV